MEGFLYSFALRDYFRLKRVVSWLLVVLALFGIAKLVHYLDQGATGESTYLKMAGFFVFRVVALAAAVFSTAVLSAEVEQKTIVYLLTRPVPRWKLILLRTLAAITAVAVVGVVAVAMVSFATYGPQALRADYVRRDLIGVFVGAMAYTSMFVLISLWVNRSMILNLLYAFGWETIVPNIPGDMRYLSIAAHLETLSQRPATQTATPINQLAVSTLTPNISWSIVTIGSVVSLAIAALWFSTNEFLPREDVE